MKQKHTFFVTVGIPSLFLIFSVLCLCVLALLTLNRSRTGMSAAQHSLEQTEKYYNACSKATETVTEIRDSLTGYASDSSNILPRCRPLQILEKISPGIRLHIL